MTPEEFAEIIEKLISNADSELAKIIRTHQRRIHAKLIDRIPELVTTSRGLIKPTMSNARTFRSIKIELGQIVNHPSFLNGINSFLSVFKEIESVNNEYFNNLTSDFSEKPIYSEITQDAIDRTLTTIGTPSKSGALSAVVYEAIEQPVVGLLDQYKGNGGNRADLISVLTEGILGTRDKLGYLENFAWRKRLTHDTLFQFNANYTQAVTNSLGLKWFKYVGNSVDDSREFCLSRIGKYYKEEEVKEWAGRNWQGKNPATTPENILTYRGGYNCRHFIQPVAEEAVPDEVRGIVSEPTAVDEPDTNTGRERTPEEALIFAKKQTKGIEKLRDKYEKVRNNRIEAIEAYNRSAKYRGGNAPELLDKYYEIDKEFKAVEREIKSKRRKIASSIQKIFIGNSSQDISIQFTNTSARTKNRLAAYADEFSKIIHGNTNAEYNYKFNIKTKFKRASHSYLSEGLTGMPGGQSFINVRASVSKATTIHELAHGIEYFDEEIRGKVRKFYDERTKGDEVIRINSTKGYEYYGNSEVYKKDKWLQPYIGRWYNERSGVRPTEIITMFFTYLYEENIDEVIDRDPEYFKFMYELFGN